MNAAELLARRHNVYTLMEGHALSPELRKKLMDELARLDEQMETIMREGKAADSENHN